MRSIACVAVLCLFSLWGYSKSRALRIRAMIMRAFGSDIQRLCREIKHRPRELRNMVLCFEGSELEGFWKLLGESLGTCERAEEAWREAAMWRGFNVLGEREREIILLCGSGLGISPSEPQLNAAQRAYEEAFSRGEELDREAAAKGGMFTKVGVLMGIDIVLRIAGIGILVAIICQLLKQTGRDDIAMLAALAGLVITLSLVVGEISTLLDQVKRIFGL